MTNAEVIPITRARSWRGVPYEAEVVTGTGRRRARVVGRLGDRAVVHWLEGRRRGQIGWPLQECVLHGPERRLG